MQLKNAEPSRVSRVLVIDDSFDTLWELVALLRREGFHAFGAKDGRRGLALARSERPDLILCDTLMPTPDGYDVLRALRGEAEIASTPCILLTTTPGLRDFRQGMNLGADDCLAKPVPTPDLLAAIRARLLRRSQQAAAFGCGDLASARRLQETLGLTPRVAESLSWVIRGKTNVEIARILGITEATVKKHLRKLFRCLLVETRTAATVRAFEALTSQTAPPPASAVPLASASPPPSPYALPMQVERGPGWTSL